MIATITGSNDFERQQAVASLIQSARQTGGDLSFELIDAEEADYATVLGAVQSLPFLAPKKTVVVRSLSALKLPADKLELLFSNVAEQVDVVVVEPKIDKRSALYKYLKAHTQYKEYTERDERSLLQWLMEYAKQQGGELSAAAAQLLLRRIGVNQAMLASEVDKLLLSGQSISETLVDKLVEATPQSSVFELVEAVCTNNKSKAIVLYEELRTQRVEPQQIIGMLTWQLNNIATVQAAPNMSANSIAAAANINPYVVQKTLALARHVSQRHINSLIQKTIVIEARLKSESLDADEALKTLIVVL